MNVRELRAWLDTFSYDAVVTISTLGVTPLLVVTDDEYAESTELDINATPPADEEQTPVETAPALMNISTADFNETLATLASTMDDFRRGSYEASVRRMAAAWRQMMYASASPPHARFED